MSTIQIEPIDAVEKLEGSPVATAVKWGAISAAVSFVLMLIFYNTGMMDMSDGWVLPMLSTILSFIIGIALIVLGLRDYKFGTNNGVLSFKKGILWSLIYGIVAALLGALLMYIFFSFLAPNYFVEMKENMAIMFENMGMEGDALDEALAGMDESASMGAQLRNTFLYSIIGSLVVGGITTLVMKNK